MGNYRKESLGLRASTMKGLNFLTYFSKLMTHDNMLVTTPIIILSILIMLIQTVISSSDTTRGLGIYLSHRKAPHCAN